jgi:acyl-CoA reductase-like NAD-dependent aldehyde dehydrogenase
VSADGSDRAVLSVGGEQREFIVSPTQRYAVLEELRFVRREAQAEADLAYEDWRRIRSSETYAVYRAAQDRADAAQDDLAEWVLRTAV